jgi:hypothetical protein
MSQGISNRINKQGMSHRDSSISKQSVSDDVKSIVGSGASESYERVTICLVYLVLSPIRSRAHQGRLGVSPRWGRAHQGHLSDLCDLCRRFLVVLRERV